MLRAHRMRLDLTQEELASRAGLSVRALRTIERGGAQPRDSSLHRLAAALELSTAELDAFLSTVGSDALWVGVLGPLAVRRGGVDLNVGAPMPRAFLGLLALHNGLRVSVAEIVEVLWGEDPPRGASDQVRVHAARLRSLLAPDRSSAVVVHSRDGYLLEDARVDLGRFDELVAEARAAADPERAFALWTEAVGSWRGPALADAGVLLRQHPAAVAASRRRVDAVVAFADAAVGLDRYDEAVPVLRDSAVTEPLHEGVHARLIVALAGAGEQAAALAVFTDIRTRLAEELGVEPGADVRAAHLRVLRQDIRTTPATVAPPTRPVMPAQLPLDVYGFTGRDRELAQLDALLARAGDQPTAVVVSAVWGTAGVGKTALALHWAHRVRDRFPDGQLYVNLRGFSPTGAVMTPGEAVRRFLDALDVPVGRVPSTVDAQVDLYRSLLAGRRVLVVLDNARDAEQVRPLLPGAPGCLAMVTSRNQLTGLVAAEGAHPLTLGGLSEVESRRLLARRLGTERLADKPDAVHSIVTSCVGLPLALVITAARIANHPGLSLDAVAEELKDGRRRLDALASDDATTNVRAVFSASYRTLSNEGARMFRLLGVHPGPDISVWAAASLAGEPASAVMPLLMELARAHLLTESSPGRYAVHDLLRTYATELAIAQESDDLRHSAVHRVLDHYLHSAYTAVRLLQPHRDEFALVQPQPGTRPERPVDHRQSLQWFVAEHSVLLATVRYAADSGWDTHTWQLAWACAIFLNRLGYVDDYITVQEAAAAAARRLDDAAVEAAAIRKLARIYSRIGRYDEALAHLYHALDLSTSTGDRRGLAYAHMTFGAVLERQGQYEEALDHSRQALSLYKSIGHSRGQAFALNAIGWDQAKLGEYRQALDTCEEALSLLVKVGDGTGQAETLDSLGFANSELGRYGEATACYQAALDIYRELGDRCQEAVILAHLGDNHHASGNFEAAGEAWQRAVDIPDGLDLSDAERLRASLSDLNTTFRSTLVAIDTTAQGPQES